MSLELTREDLDRLFPAHMETTTAGVITACGSSLNRHLEMELVGRNLLDEFSVERPVNVDETEDLLIDQQTVILSNKTNSTLRLRGIIIRRADRFALLLGHTPPMTRNDQAIKYRFSDFAPFDGTQDIFLAAEVRKGLLDDTQTLAEQLNAEKLAAEAAAVAKSNFLACMSHEIRTPLNGVLGIASILSDSGLSTRQKELVGVLQESGENLLTLLNDILDLSKIDAGKTEIEKLDFTIGDLTREIQTVYQLKCEDKNLRFDLEIDQTLHAKKFVGDPTRIRQILNNLVSNSVKFTERGAVSVRVSEAASKPGELMTLKIEVSDTGIGIDNENLGALFSPFVQEDSTVTRKFGGTGLGLSITKRLCDLMGGELFAESEKSVGSTFSVLLPLGCALDEPLEPSEPVGNKNPYSGENCGSRNFLAAEDNIVNQKVLTAILETLGHSVTIVANGHEVIDAYLKNDFDAILMDIQMPVMDGMEATKKIRDLEASQKLPNTPIVAVTANAMKEHEDEYLSIGFDHYLSKPITKEKLDALIAALFRSALEVEAKRAVAN